MTTPPLSDADVEALAESLHSALRCNCDLRAALADPTPTPSTEA